MGPQIPTLAEEKGGSTEVKTIKATQEVGNTFYELLVRQFIPQHGDSLGRKCLAPETTSGQLSSQSFFELWLFLHEALQHILYCSRSAFTFGKPAWASLASQPLSPPTEEKKKLNQMKGSIWMALYPSYPADDMDERPPAKGRSTREDDYAVFPFEL
jgi:hypothetical protein